MGLTGIEGVWSFVRSMSEEIEKHWSRHPMIVLLLGAGISSLLVPAYQANGLKQQEEEARRTRFIREIHQFDGEVNTHLNSLTTAMELTLKLDGQGEGVDPANFRSRAMDAYADFDRVAWWKLDALCSEYASSAAATPHRQEAMWGEVAAYEAVLAERAELFAPAWSMIFGDGDGDEGVTVEWFRNELRPQQETLIRKGQGHLMEMIRIVNE